MSQKIAVILLNLGGPGTLDEVRPFLMRLFSDREIIRLPLQPLFSRLIVCFRLKNVLDNYRKIGGGSPILKITQQQGEALQDRLRRSGIDASVRIAMRYTSPTASEVVAEIEREEADKVIALPLYPHYSRTTTGSSLNDLDRAFEKAGIRKEYTAVRSWCDHPAYLDVLASKVREGLADFPEECRDEVEVVFSAHALPQRMIDEGDPYLSEIEKTVRGVVERVDGISHHLAFQSRSGPVKWMRPGTEEVIDRLAAAGKKALLMVPVSFVSDHIETLYEIDMLYRDRAKERGITEYRRTESINIDPEFINVLARIVEEHMGKKNVIRV
ncbi:MAG: ferrochelatase [Deltaproteobacteria bacterium]|nr:ferrochelatase [Deltaproteobacteria bacterium]